MSTERAKNQTMRRPAMADIVLVQPAAPQEFTRLVVGRSLQPLGVLSVATYLRYALPDLSLSVWDGEVDRREDIAAAVRKARLVGLSLTYLNHLPAMELAQEAHERGAIVVAGGHNTSYLYREILTKRPYVDALVIGDGERAFAELVRLCEQAEAKVARGRSTSEAFRNLLAEEGHGIPNLAFRRGDQVVRTEALQLNLDELPEIDRNLLDVEAYVRNFGEDLPAMAQRFPRQANIYSHKGCTWRTCQQKRGRSGCVFCARADTGWRGRSPRRLWDEVEHLISQQQASLVYDLGDDLLTNRRWLRELVNERECRFPDESPVAFSTFGRTQPFRYHGEKLAELSRRLGVVEVFIGAESGDPDILRRMNKGTTPDDTRRAVRFLGREGIAVFVGLVLGLPGETQQSLNQTHRLVDELLETGLISGIQCAVMWVVPGAPAFELLARHGPPEAQHLIRGADYVDLVALQEWWAKCFTEVPLDVLERQQAELLATAMRTERCAGSTLARRPSLTTGATQ